MVSVDAVKETLENLDMERFWQLCCADPVGVLRKLSVRQVGSTRLERFLAHLKGMDANVLSKNRSYLVLVKILLENEIGTGMFKNKGEGK